MSTANLSWPHALLLCREVLARDVAFVNIEVVPPSVEVIRRQRRTTFSDKLGSLGGNVGLFTGVSLLGAYQLLRMAAMAANIVVGHFCRHRGGGAGMGRRRSIREI